jgi:hypothetical protein
MMVYLLYEDVTFWSMDAIVFHCSKLQQVVFFSGVGGMMMHVSAPV